MAERLASIFGTEKDRVNCPFYHKIGACRHGDRCSRLHNRPTFSLTLMFPNMYMGPRQLAERTGQPMPVLTDEDLRMHFEEFYYDVFTELDKFGAAEEMVVCDNVADHLVGNVYVRFREDEGAVDAFEGVAGRFYNGRMLVSEYSPVTDFREARCRQHDLGRCNRGGYCNFLHLKPISRDLHKECYGNTRRWYPGPTDDDRRGGGGGRYGRGPPPPGRYQRPGPYPPRHHDDRRRDRYDDRHRYDDRDRDRGRDRRGGRHDGGGGGGRYERDRGRDWRGGGGGGGGAPPPPPPPAGGADWRGGSAAPPPPPPQW